MKDLSKEEKKLIEKIEIITTFTFEINNLIKEYKNSCKFEKNNNNFRINDKTEEV